MEKSLWVGRKTKTKKTTLRGRLDEWVWGCYDNGVLFRCVMGDLSAPDNPFVIIALLFAMCVAGVNLNRNKAHFINENPSIAVPVTVPAN